MHETSKSIFHKIKDSRYGTRYIVGNGIDIGSGEDCLSQYGEFFPLMNSCRAWDTPDGDAQLMESIEDNYFDFVYSSHCLEHTVNPYISLDNWIRILKPGGHLVCTIPDEDLYEQGIFPSTFNHDHKHTFTIHKKKSWSNKSINLIQMLSNTSLPIEIKKIELLDATFRYNLNQKINIPRFDQSMTPIGECAIEFVLKKIML
ncbi:methyltransferase domain-containing protein [Prochlorococcus marinus]|uniref:methyltransferase domain-containing protein n=1 Tax=Prochlorococcus marinus TaxID=1219 RepID=UPI0022B446FE|nr:methyltransferase domain-containing protein [Prochlorococcus marinus]